MVHFATVWWFLQIKHALFFHSFFSWRKTALQYRAGFCCESEVVQLCPTLCDPMDHSLPGSSDHGIFQARVLEWAAISQIRHNYPYITSLVSLSVLPLSHLSELSHRAKLGTLCYIATSHLLSILHMVVYIYFNANFCIHPTLSFPDRVHTTQSSNHTSWYLPSGTQNLYPCKTST